MTTTTAIGLARETIAPDEPEVIKAFIAFLKEASERRHPTGPIRRFNQGRAAGCVDGEFIVPADLPPDYRVGLFARPGTYRAFVRFANASSKSDREKDVRGMAISIAAAPGTNLTPGATTQDFVLNSHRVMVAPDAREFLDLLRALEAGGFRSALYFATHPRAAVIGFASRQNPSCHLDIWYWSATPYLFGPGRAVKYVLRPCSERKSAVPSPLTDTYLTDALRTHLQQADGCFDFMIQLQTDPRRMPIENASVEWKEQDSPYIPVARLRIPRQQVDPPGRAEACEAAAFNPWHSLAEHRPLGSMNRARQDIYRELALFRHARLRSQ